jgi:hypothetical protein
MGDLVRALYPGGLVFGTMYFPETFPAGTGGFVPLVPRLYCARLA